MLMLLGPCGSGMVALALANQYSAGRSFWPPGIIECRDSKTKRRDNETCYRCFQHFGHQRQQRSGRAQASHILCRTLPRRRELHIWPEQRQRQAAPNTQGNRHIPQIRAPGVMTYGGSHKLQKALGWACCKWLMLFEPGCSLPILLKLVAVNKFPEENN